MKNNASTMINGQKLDMNKCRLKMKAAPTYQENEVLELYSNSNSGCTDKKESNSDFKGLSWSFDC